VLPLRRNYQKNAGPGCIDVASLINFHRFAKQFLEIVKLFAPPGAETSLAGFKAAVDFVGRREDKNREELLTAIAEEVKSRGSQIEHLQATSEAHRSFMEEEMPGGAGCAAARRTDTTERAYSAARADSRARR
jgi:hypothetical protein